MENVNIVRIIYCVDADQLETAIECEMIVGYTDVNKLTSTDRRNFLEKDIQEVKDVVTESELTATVQAALRIKMSVKSSKGRMKMIYIEDPSLLKTNSINWLTYKTPKVAIKNALSSVNPVQLRARLEQDLALSYNHIKSDFQGFMEHA